MGGLRTGTMAGMTRIVFDFGGVLFRWRPQELVQRELPHRAPDAASAERWVTDIFQSYGGDWGEFDRGAIEADVLARRIALRTGLSVDEVNRVIVGAPQELQPVAAVVDLLARLREQGSPLYYLSNMPAPFAAHLEREHRFMKWFADGVFSSRVQLIKPDPAIFAYAAQAFGEQPGDLVFLDDHLPNHS